MNIMKSARINMLLAALSGLLLTGAFPKIGLDWLAWFALVPLLAAIANLSVKQSFRIGFIAGWVSLLAGFSGAIAFAAAALEEYALPRQVGLHGCLPI